MLIGHAPDFYGGGFAAASARLAELLDLALGRVEPLAAEAVELLAALPERRAPRRAAPRRSRAARRSASSSCWASSKVGSCVTRRARRSAPSATLDLDALARLDGVAERTISLARADDRVAALERRARRERAQAAARCARAARGGARASSARRAARAARARRRAAARCALEAAARAALEAGARAVEPLRAARRGRGRRAGRRRVGVEARTSAARSQSGVSCSWPTARHDRHRAGGDRAHEPLVAERAAGPRSCRRRARGRRRRRRSRQSARERLDDRAPAARGPWT